MRFHLLCVLLLTACSTQSLQQVHPMVHLSSPLPDSVISSPLTIQGEARGMWFFEANFPIVLTTSEGTVLAEHYATAEDDWMTEEFVPFTAVLEFESPETEQGILILKKANASGLPEHDDEVEILVLFQ